MHSKVHRVILLLAVFTLVWATPVPASQLSFTTTHTFTVSLINDDTGSSVSPTYWSISADASANTEPSGDWNGASDYKDIYSSEPYSAIANLDTMTWLKATGASIACDGSATLTLSQTLVGYGPQPSSADYDGYLYQNASVFFEFNFTAPEAGSYTATLTDIYNLACTLAQGSGDGYPFYSTYGYSYLYGAIEGPTGNGGFDKQALDDYKNAYPNPLADFSIIRDKKKGLVTVFLDDVPEGDTITFHGEVVSYQEGYTMVPIPGTVLLLGTGLVGLGLAGSRIRRRT